MKTQLISKQQAEKIYADNAEYLVWADGSPITVDDIQNYFFIHGNNIEHKTDDFRIEDIILPNA